MRMEVLRVSEDANEDELARSVGVQTASDEEIGQRYSVRSLLPHRR